jgi:hypothetical protein
MSETSVSDPVFPWLDRPALDRIRRSMKKAAKLKGHKISTFHVLATGSARK